MTDYKNAVTMNETVEVTIYDSYEQSFLSLREYVGEITGSDGSKFTICRDLNGIGFYVDDVDIINGKRRNLTAYVTLNDLLMKMAKALIANQTKV